MLALLILLFSTAAAQAAQPTSLLLKTPGHERAVSIEELQKALPLTQMTVNDPVYHSNKTYEGFDLAKVLRWAGLGSSGGDELIFHCEDGYSPTLDWKLFAGHHALLAIREKGLKEGWEKIRQGKQWISPAPFYVVWDTSEEAYPWPYQLNGIEVIRFSAHFNRIYPVGQPQDSPVYAGFELFRSKCLKCHSINLQGGDQCPELNYPKNVTEYRDEATLRAFILNASSFSARSKMPAFPDLAGKPVDEVLAYLHWMKDHKAK